MDLATSYTKYNISFIAESQFQVCYWENMIKNATPWQNQNALIKALPYLTIQLALVIFVTRFLILILKPLHQPNFVAEVIAGFLLGPSLFGATWLGFYTIPFETNMLLVTFANLGLTYYMFLVGLEMDLSTIKHMEKKSLSIAIAGTLVPLCTGAGLYFLPLRSADSTKNFFVEEFNPKGAIFWATALTITSFPNLARILSDVKLLHTDLGKMALKTAIICEISAWVLLVGAITFSDNDHEFYMEAVPTIVFLLFCYYLVRPGIAWIINRTRSRGGEFGDTHIHFALAGVAVFGLIGDQCGTHSIVGGFLFGLMFPHGELAMMIMERSEQFVNGIMLPAFIFLNGIRTDLKELGNADWIYVMVVIILCTSAKIVSSIISSLYFGMSTKDGFTLGSLMNTKGVFALIVLNEGRSLKALDSLTQAVMEITILFMTFFVGPIFFLIKVTTRNTKPYKKRTIQRSNPNTELRILTCIHSARNLSGIIKLLEISNATRTSPLCVFAVHLVELTRRASAMLVVYDPRKPRTSQEEEPEKIMTAFGNFETRNDAVTVHSLTTVSPYSTMHDDIRSLAEDRRVAMILVPFHKQPTADGGLKDENHSIREVNQNLLIKATCSVGILVDRGIGTSLCCLSLVHGIKAGLRLAMIFVGGPDDQEALSYAWRMAGTMEMDITLTVVRFIPIKLVADQQNKMPGSDENINDEEISEPIMNSDEIQKELDDEFMNEFRFKSMCDSSITYSEKLVNNGDELLESLRSMYNDFDLYIVGRGQRLKSPLTMGLSEWSDHPELGPIGDSLTSSEFTSHASVLVVQQSVSCGSTTSSVTAERKLGQRDWVSPILNPDYAAFVNNKNN